MIEAGPSVFKHDVEMNLAALEAIDYNEWLEHLEGPMMEIPLITEAAVKYTNRGYKKLPRTLRKSRKLCYLAGDAEIVLAAVEQNGTALKYAHAKLQKNKTIVSAAVQNTGRALCYCHSTFTRNRDIVLLAVSTWGKALKLQFASLDLQSDYEFTLECVKCNPESMAFAAPCLQSNPGWVHRAVRLTI